MEVFEQVQSLLESKARRGRGSTRKKKRLFTNIPYCSECGNGQWYRANRRGLTVALMLKNGNNS
jgi:site-specific DNA recombinase